MLFMIFFVFFLLFTSCVLGVSLLCLMKFLLIKKKKTRRRHMEFQIGDYVMIRTRLERFLPGICVLVVLDR